MWARLASAVCVMEAIVLGLALPVIHAGRDSGSDQTSLPVLAVIAVLLLLLPGVLRRRGGRAIGWLLQVATVVASIRMIALLTLALVFAWLWWLGLRWGDRIDRDRAAYAVTDPQ